MRVGAWPPAEHARADDVGNGVASCTNVDARVTHAGLEGRASVKARARALMVGRHVRG